MTGLASSANGLGGRLFAPGRTFVSPAFDYLLIGGGLSLLAAFVLPSAGSLHEGDLAWIVLPWAVLVFNSAHFAASTVRLYSKPGAFAEFPFLTMILPILSIGVVTLAVLLPAQLGQNLTSLYLTWSPYHYAAQAFGLATMYTYRSGSQLEGVDRRLVWWSCMLPFLSAFASGQTTGIGWFVPGEVFAAYPALLEAKHLLSSVLGIATFAAPALLVWRLSRPGRQRLPLISLLIMVANGVWWIVFVYLDAFLWATVFHGIQYLAIVTIFHVRDQTKLPDNRHGFSYHVLGFYAACVALGYALFSVWPYAYSLAGFELGSSVIAVAAVVNLHHFIVDRFIWRLRKDRNYQIVVSDTPAAQEKI